MGKILYQLVFVMHAVLLPTQLFGLSGILLTKKSGSLKSTHTQLVYSRSEDKNVISLRVDYQGDSKNLFYLVPTFGLLEKDQIHLGDRSLFDHLEAYSAPRVYLSEDENPCHVSKEESEPQLQKPSAKQDAEAVTVGEYQVITFSPRESREILSWLKENSYAVNPQAADIIHRYREAGLSFFGVAITLKEAPTQGIGYLRPIQWAFDSAQIRIPAQLGLLQAEEMDLEVFFLTRSGSAKPLGSPLLKVPENARLPYFVGENFSDFYEALLREQSRRESGFVFQLEFFGPLDECSPCTADPFTLDELRSLGAHWMGSLVKSEHVYLTRMKGFPRAGEIKSDLAFEIVSETEKNFQTRYYLRKSWHGKDLCENAKAYAAGLPVRLQGEADKLAEWTGWEFNQIRRQMGVDGDEVTPRNKRWWQKIWPTEKKNP